MNKLPVIRIESLYDSEENDLMITISGCYLNDDDVLIETCGTVSDMVHAQVEVAKLRKQGFEFQLVKVSSTI